MQRSIAGLAIALSFVGTLRAQDDSSDLKIFGYFQPQFYYQTAVDPEPANNSFVLQQLNLFFQKDLGKRLSSFVNFEAVNSFSSDQQWGSFRLEEAWVRYRESRTLNVKVGLQIPIFNNFNEIKNRMPLIPYVIRPLVYESSFVDVIPVRIFVPQQAFVQAYGWHPIGNLKIDYAAYLGNTELVNSGFNADPDGTPNEQTGVDTTNAVMVGGRVGIRIDELKAGFSATFDRSAVFQGAEELTGLTARRYFSIPRQRTGADVSYYFRGWSIEAEWINVAFDEPPELDLDLAFYYATLGYRLSEKLLVYGGYWLTKERSVVVDRHELIDINVPIFGLAYTLEDQITLKVQFADVDVDIDYRDSKERFVGTTSYQYMTVAVSVAF